MSGERFTLVDALARLAAGEDLSGQQARESMADLLSGEATAAQVGAFLMGLRLKGETVDEVVGLVEAMREASVRIAPARAGCMDLCGTGGDGSGTFNISTAASLVVAGAGVGVAKHGNRSASSRCGSADVLEAMGVPIDQSPEDSTRAIDEIGFAFLFARRHHPAMRHVAGPRGELRFRTVFNILGPLTNPAGVKIQLLGVFDDALRAVMAHVLRNLGSERVWVVHGTDGLDEISIAAATRVTSIDAGNVLEIEITPEDAGLPRRALREIAGGDAQQNARILEGVLDGEKGAYRDAVVLNAAGALVVAGVASDLRTGAELAVETIDSGRAREFVARLRKDP
jgi:anthranilate phosphoribosyltransferase